MAIQQEAAPVADERAIAQQSAANLQRRSAEQQRDWLFAGADELFRGL